MNDSPKPDAVLPESFEMAGGSRVPEVESESARVAQICAIANAFKQSQLLFVAHRAGLFQYLQTPRTALEVALHIGWAQRGADVALNALVGQELLLRAGNRYQNAPLAEACLCPSGGAYLGHYLAHTQRGWESWSRLDDSLASGANVKRGRPALDNNDLHDFVWGMDDLARINAADLLAAVDFASFRNLLDVGGGLGRHAEAFLEASPALTATVFETPAVAPLAQERLAQAGLASRCRCVAGDFREDDLGSGFDAVLLSNVVHALSAEDVCTVLARCHAALDSGGTLMIKDFFIDEGDSSPAFSALFSLDMLLHTGSGRTYSGAEISRWCREAGFAEDQMRRLGVNARLWVTQKP